MGAVRITLTPSAANARDFPEEHLRGRLADTLIKLGFTGERSATFLEIKFAATEIMELTKVHHALAYFHPVTAQMREVIELCDLILSMPVQYSSSTARACIISMNISTFDVVTGPAVQKLREIADSKLNRDSLEKEGRENAKAKQISWRPAAITAARAAMADGISMRSHVAHYIRLHVRLAPKGDGVERWLRIAEHEGLPPYDKTQ